VYEDLDGHVGVRGDVFDVGDRKLPRQDDAARAHACGEVARAGVGARHLRGCVHV
jgi:hypothetical protein